MKSTWKGVPKDISKYVGFVYKIIENDTGMIYFGLKRFYFKKSLPPLKGRKNRRRSLVESDWKTYNTSSPIMQHKLQKNPTNYTKTIIKCCTTLTDMKCTEAYWQLKYWYEGNWDLLYNQVISLRLRIR